MCINKKNIYVFYRESLFIIVIRKKDVSEINLKWASKYAAFIPCLIYMQKTIGILRKVPSRNLCGPWHVHTADMHQNFAFMDFERNSLF